MWRVPRRGGSGEEEKRWAVTHFDADRLMTEYYLQREYFDLIDVDSFGSDSSYFRPAINALKWGGLLYFTSTDGYTSGASYGAYVCRVPYSNEVGLRKVIGGAVREASVLGYHVTPLFSYYSFHGPVFRVMLRLSRGMLPDKRHYGFIGYCKRCGHSQAFSWDELGGIDCPCDKSNVWLHPSIFVFLFEIEPEHYNHLYLVVGISKKEERGVDDNIVSGSPVVLGPLWTGPLHTTTYITEMLNLAEQWGWTNSGMGLDLEKLLRQMIDESHPGLPPGYIIMDEVAKRAKVNSPRIKTMMSSIHQEGYVACRSHIAPNALKTNCPMAECVRIAKELDGAE
ncbi:hypothetical protein RHMOL_Rhmol03G0175000 [Rhododendron molle]|uniref:Uncharacterized protein n=1 Tax=Rhododendron molle TaxID=49168 RepID=A0ACC0PGU0_RHOML|nr:hypothetical protein RHMOL_Rhmol03G0175000 [Rhododendron molle]